MIEAKIIADSNNSANGRRLTTVLLTYPRYIHAEVMTHRVFSRNAASSRAIPTAKFRRDVVDNPVIPIHWGANQSGMSADSELDEKTQEAVKRLWLATRDICAGAHLALEELGLHKQIANRIIEPWFHIQLLVSSTEWQNWFALRCHEDAHPDIQDLSDAILDQYMTSRPTWVKPGDWHLPYGDQDLPMDMPINDKVKICVARAARISYKNFDGEISFEKDLALHDRLKESGHWSPFEHPAQAMKEDVWSGNIRGFAQYRKMFDYENREIDLDELWAARKARRQKLCNPSAT